MHLGVRPKGCCPSLPPLPTGVRLDPAGKAIDLGSLPINLVLTPEKDRVVVALSGWRERTYTVRNALIESVGRSP